jgi:hypothetical protein
MDAKTELPSYWDTTHIMAQLFLTQFDPTIPRVGTKRGAAVKRMTVSDGYLCRGLRQSSTKAYTATDSGSRAKTVRDRIMQPVVSSSYVYGLYGHCNV